MKISFKFPYIEKFEISKDMKLILKNPNDEKYHLELTLLSMFLEIAKFGYVIIKSYEEDTGEYFIVALQRKNDADFKNGTTVMRHNNQSFEVIDVYYTEAEAMLYCIFHWRKQL